MKRIKQMKLFQEANELARQVEDMKASLEQVCRDSSTDLQTRYRALNCLTRLGGAHKDWIFHGWDIINSSVIRSLEVPRHEEVCLFDVLENYLYNHLSEEFIQYNGAENIIEWACFVRKHTDARSMLEAMCEHCAVTFKYDW